MPSLSLIKGKNAHSSNRRQSSAIKDLERKPSESLTVNGLGQGRLRCFGSFTFRNSSNRQVLNQAKGERRVHKES